MAFLVEDGSIVAGANAYLSVADFDAYWLDRNITLSQTQAEKEAAIIIATQYLDQNKWKGAIVSDAQPLDFPRGGVYDQEGREIPNNIIPQQVKHACAEYAHRQLTAPIQPDLEGGAVKRTKSKLGTLEEEIEYADGSVTTRPRYPMADNLIKSLTATTGRMGKLVRC